MDINRGALLSSRRWFWVGLAALLVLPLGSAAIGGSARSEHAWSFSAVVEDPIRSEEDRRADEVRKPEAFLSFTGVRPGMNVLDMAAGGGYTAQLLALATKPGGVVWAQNAQPSPSLELRLTRHVQPNFHQLVRPMEDPYPAGSPALDLITLILSFHDIAYQPVDRDKMAQRMFALLKPGGHLVVIDHAASAGSGIADAKRLHRIDEALVRDQLIRAGFRQDAESDFLRNSNDPREQAFFDINMPTDRFALRFVKPE